MAGKILTSNMLSLGMDDENAIWQRQSTYLNAFNRFAVKVFDSIDPGLKPEIFLIGINNRPRYDFTLPSYYQSVRLQKSEPQRDLWKVAQLEPAVELFELDRIFEIAKDLESDTRSTKNVLPSDRAKIETLRLALHQILSAKTAYGERDVFVSGGQRATMTAEINGYSMFTILLLEKNVLDGHKLPDSFWPETIKNRDGSLAESAATLILKECTLTLRDPHKGFLDNIIEKSAEELLHRAASVLTESISKGLAKPAGLNLFEACNLISSMSYEGAEGVGKIILMTKHYPDPELMINLESPFPVKDFRKVRKFLEISNKDLSVVSDGSHIIGLCQNEEKKGTWAQMLAIEFTGHFRWKLRFKKQVLLSVAYNQPVIEVRKIDQQKFHSDLSRIFTGLLPEEIKDLWLLVQAGMNQKHGTILVISDEAQSEAMRLRSQALVVQPVKLSAAMMLPISAIDGAVLMDRHGVCHAIGVILDGPATEKGDSSRGARYNSAIKYFQNQKRGGVLIIIISEDGLVNLIPDLMPQVSRVAIARNIEILRQLAQEHEPDEVQVVNIMAHLINQKFYLRKGDCIAINRYSKRLANQLKNSIYISFLDKKLKPNQEMDDSYYLD
jgi:hypothetical protein